MELLIVIVVIGILAAITIVSYNVIKNRALDSTMQSDIENAYKLIENDNTVNGFYPGLGSSVNGGKGIPKTGSNVINYSFNAGTPQGYTLIVTNPGSSDSYIITNLNNVPKLISNPAITNPGQDTSIATGGCGQGSQYYNMNLNSSGSGTPSLSIQWQVMAPKNTMSGTWSNIVGATNTYVTYTDTTLFDGDYRVFRVLYSNGSNTVTSPTIKDVLSNGC